MIMLRNMFLIRALNGMMSYEAYHEEKLNVAHLRLFETTIFCKDHQQKNKLSERAWTGRLVGQEGTKIVRVYDPVRMKVYRSAHFHFGSLKACEALHVDEEE